METTLKLSIYELRQVMADGTLAALAESICSLEGKSFDQAKKEYQTIQQNSPEPVMPGQMQMDIPQPVPTIVPTPPAPPIQSPAVPVMPAPMPTAVPVMPAPMPTAVPPVAPVPTTVQTYSMEQLAIAATQLMDAGRKADVIFLLGEFGVQALTLLPKERYGAFATRLRELGAKI